MRLAGYALIAAASFGVRAKADPPDASAEARSAINVMQSNASHVRQLLLEARRGRVPPSQVGCVNGALTRADVAVRVSRELYADLRAALLEGERNRAATMLLAIFAHREAARTAVREADSCISPVVRAPLDTTTVHVVVDKPLPPDAVVFR
jgi:hypothetical protein